MNLMSLKYVKTTAVFWGICLAVFVIVFMFVIKPQVQTMNTKEGEYNEKNKQYERLKIEAQESTRMDLQKEIDSLKAKFDRFVVSSPSAMQTLASIEIDKIGTDMGLKLDIDPWNSGVVQAFSDCKYVQGQFIKVTFDANFPDFAKLLNNIERYKSVIFIDSFSVTKSQENEGKQKIEMNLAILVAKPQKDSHT